MTHAERKSALEALLLRFQQLWRPQPFRSETPDWCTVHPELTSELLALDNASVEGLAADNVALIRRLSAHVPAVANLAELIAFDDAAPIRQAMPPRLAVDIPGRKQAQIEAYADALAEPRAPVLEWCAGKGHLGRLLAHRWHLPITSLELDATLCEAGAKLARQTGLDDRQTFVRADALAPDTAQLLVGRHAIALHACGDLHTRLVAGCIDQSSPAIDIAPCCYYRTAHEHYRPFNPTALTLSRDDLRLAVTETVTASAKQRLRSRQALAWKLGWVELRKTLTGENAYRTFPPVPEMWLREDFPQFASRMAERARLDIPTYLQAELPRFAARGQERADRMLRLQLVRFAFRRPLEAWLLMDMAIHLERHGYSVVVSAFCPDSMTPRNLLLSARRL